MKSLDAIIEEERERFRESGELDQCPLLKQVKQMAKNLQAYKEQKALDIFNEAYQEENDQMNRIMLDLETMGTGPNAAIVAIGAVRFNDTEVTDEFYGVVNLESSVSAGMEIDPNTVLWWMRQSDEARGQFLRGGMAITPTLLNFSNWLGGDAEVWGNGAAFDNVILANAYQKCGLPQPWKFWNDRCYRTIKNLYPNVPFERTGTHHNAVDDARSQALHLIEIPRTCGVPGGPQ